MCLDCALQYIVAVVLHAITGDPLCFLFFFPETHPHYHHSASSIGRNHSGGGHRGNWASLPGGLYRANLYLFTVIKKKEKKKDILTCPYM